MYDLAIIGGGPAGAAAAVYAARKRLKTAFVAEVMGGQSTDSLEIQNWIGTEKISGADLAKSFEAHVRAYAGEIVDLHIGERAEEAIKSANGFSVKTNVGTYEAKSLLVVTGGSRRKLEVPGAAEFENKGVVYCASCDGPLFSGQNVVVVGGGNAGFETAQQLLAYCPSVTLVHRNADFAKADPATVATVLAHPNMHVLTNSTPTEVKGKTFVSSIVVQNKETGAVTEVPAAGVFVEVGALPATMFVRDLVTVDPIGHIKTDPRNQRTSVEGVWAAGDCTDGLYHQNNIAAGDAVRALEDIFYWLKSRTS